LILLTDVFLFPSGWKDKPLSKWNEEDVDGWLQAQPKFKVLSDKKILQSFAGSDLFNTTKEMLTYYIREHIHLKTLEPKNFAIIEPLFNAIQHLKAKGIVVISHLFLLFQNSLSQRTSGPKTSRNF